MRYSNARYGQPPNSPQSASSAVVLNSASHSRICSTLRSVAFFPDLIAAWPSRFWTVEKIQQVPKLP